MHVWFVSSFFSGLLDLMTANFFCVQSSTDNVAVSVDQFYTIRATLLASIEEEEKAGKKLKRTAREKGIGTSRHIKK
jgi:hypothetical protein